MSTQGQVYRRSGRREDSGIPDWCRYVALVDVSPPSNGCRRSVLRSRGWIDPADVYVAESEIDRADSKVAAIVARIADGVDPVDGLGRGYVGPAVYVGVLRGVHVNAFHRRSWRAFGLNGGTVFKCAAIVPPDDPDAPAE